ncbi:TRF2-interacting telomeric protein/Rap1 C terminal domain-containing protein [Xylaria arbuscula]|nr:TRF2-interacting telomeric protein/Rap1 C terminal domain-containing protein [Xylaria arbuscula]
MSAPGITYSGALAKKGVGVFGGFKFWVSARVPQRKSCVNSIEEHGGTVVAREGNADILICDEAKAPVPGSYSYKLISEAIGEGSLDIKEDYLCDSLATNPTSSIKPGPGPKLTRKKFTEEDDRILMKFVTEQDRLGEPTGGNDIYKKLADKYPHHTWQSWRDRWVKKLKAIAPPLFSDREQSPQPGGTSAASGLKKAAKTSPVARTRARFTAEEDDILLEAIHRAIENHEPWNGYQPYKQLANEFPQRTYLSWRERALNHVAKQNKDQIAQWEFEAGFHPSDNEDAPADNAGKRQENKASTKSAITAQGSENAPRDAVDDLPEEDATHEGANENNNGQEGQVTVSSPIHSARSAEPDSISIVSQLPEDDITVTTEGQFYRDYNTFLESVGVTERSIPSVRGKAISLWGLWQSVRSKNTADVELDWQQIAEDLGFDWVSMESVPKDLQQCYEEHLVPFADAMMSFNDLSDDEESTQNPDIETDRLLPSSPPVLPSLKRSLTTTSPVYIPLSSPKRRRIDRSTEIPSTPEHMNRKSKPGSLRPFDKTPTNSRASHPVTHSSVAGSISRTQTRSRARNGDKRRPEPETQDFIFGPDTQAIALGEGQDPLENNSQRGITPSQQLIQESDAISPEIQHNTPTPATSRQGIGQTTPTPHRGIQDPFPADNSDGDVQRNNTRSRSTRAPLSTQQAQPKRRTLPPSFIPNPTASSITVQTHQPSSSKAPETASRRIPSPPKETPDDVIDRFVSLGYSKVIVLRSLKATSWILGNAGQVMEMLKQGEPLPPRTSGVWTQRDDESLALVYSHIPPTTTKEEKKRERETKRLQAKHGTEQIALRKRYLLDELPE